MYCSGMRLDQCCVVSGIGPVIWFQLTPIDPCFTTVFRNDPIRLCSGVGLDQCTVVEWDWTSVL